MLKTASKTSFKKSKITKPSKSQSKKRQLPTSRHSTTPSRQFSSTTTTSSLTNDNITNTTKSTNNMKSTRIARPRRSLLYIPGSSLKMLSKASKSGADTVAFDLEDGVSVLSKQLARHQIKTFLENEMNTFPSHLEVCLRINATSSGELFQQDVDWLNTLNFAPHSIALPKMDTVDDFKQIITVITNLEQKHNKPIELIGMIESPLALINLPDILKVSKLNDNQHQHLTSLIFGGDDYSSMSGCLRTDSNHELDFPRALMQLHASAHQITCIDIVCKEFKDSIKFETESKLSVERGYVGRQCIHPNQIIPANEIYAPTQKLFDWSIGVINEFNTQTSQGVGAFTYLGQMIDMPTIKIAENILARGKACGLQSNITITTTTTTTTTDEKL